MSAAQYLSVHMFPLVAFTYYLQIYKLTRYICIPREWLYREGEGKHELTYTW